MGVDMPGSVPTVKHVAALVRDFPILLPLHAFTSLHTSFRPTRLARYPADRLSFTPHGDVPAAAPSVAASSSSYYII